MPAYRKHLCKVFPEDLRENWLGDTPRVQKYTCCGQLDHTALKCMQVSVPGACECYLGQRESADVMEVGVLSWEVILGPRDGPRM